jgi:hypothetical protein
MQYLAQGRMNSEQICGNVGIQDAVNTPQIHSLPASFRAGEGEYAETWYFLASTVVQKVNDINPGRTILE